MIIKKVEIENFRNIENLILVPCKNVNVIYGENAQGKTNIIEAIWLFCGGKSFRGGKENDFINLKKEYFKNNLFYFDDERENSIEIRLKEKKEIFFNKVEKKNLSDIAGQFLCVVFTPEHLGFVKGNPEIRRKFIDTAICQIKPSYIKLLHKYYKVLAQRNALLKNICYNGDLLEILDDWDKELSVCGEMIIKERENYLKEAAEIAKEYYKGISGEKEELEIEYKKSYENGFSEAIKKSRETDIKSGFTNIGPHRDDIEIRIDGKNGKSFASQGQARSVILTLKLAEGKMIENKLGKKAVFLLDDVMSELDEGRQDFILNHVKENQVFITCCDISSVLRLFSGKIFKIKSGKIEEENEVK